MKLRHWTIIALVTSLLVTSAAIALAQEAPLASGAGPGISGQAISYTHVTEIVVNSTADLDTSDSTTCLSKPAEPCTLRRAVIQARGLSPAQKPVLIRFNIPTADAGYDAALQIWRIQFAGISSNAQATLRYLNGQIIIDGDTQPGGRTSGPKIILVGEGTGQRDGLKLGETAAQNANQIYRLGFQNFKTHLYLNSSNNVVAENWFGLNLAGMAPYLRNNNAQDGSGSAGVAFSAGVSGNSVRDNKFLAFDGVAIAVRGNGNTVAGNWVGMAANGTTPGKQTSATLICTPDDWLGGGGISVADQNQTVENNILAGLRQEIFAISQQPDAIRVTGSGHAVRNNQIGKTQAGAEVGVCGRGIFLSDGPKTSVISANSITNPRLSGISVNGALCDAITLRSNVVKSSTAWVLVAGASKPEDAIQMGPSLPDPYELFVPAKVNSISGASVSGGSGAGSPCPGCTVELFLDDTDSISEALQSLAVVTANSSGNWTATLPRTLTSNEGIRTISTSNQFNAIPGRSSGTSTGLSVLYRAVQPTPTRPPTTYLPLSMKNLRR